MSRRATNEGARPIEIEVTNTNFEKSMCIFQLKEINIFFAKVDNQRLMCLCFCLWWLVERGCWLFFFFSWCPTYFFSRVLHNFYLCLCPYKLCSHHLIHFQLYQHQVRALKVLRHLFSFSWCRSICHGRQGPYRNWPDLAQVATFLAQWSKCPPQLSLH